MAFFSCDTEKKVCEAVICATAANLKDYFLSALRFRVLEAWWCYVDAPSDRVT